MHNVKNIHFRVVLPQSRGVTTMGEENKRRKEIPVKQRIKEEGVISVKQWHMHIDIPRNMHIIERALPFFTIEWNYNREPHGVFIMRKFTDQKDNKKTRCE